jgi:hypothetical protein
MIVIDTSAIIAILKDEPERRFFTEAIERAETGQRPLRTYRYPVGFHRSCAVCGSPSRLQEFRAAWRGKITKRRDPIWKASGRVELVLPESKAPLLGCLI